MEHNEAIANTAREPCTISEVIVEARPSKVYRCLVLCRLLPGGISETLQQPVIRRDMKGRVAHTSLHFPQQLPQVIYEEQCVHDYVAFLEVPDTFIVSALYHGTAFMKTR